MASTSETGHAINVANFEDLISYCMGYGATYNPSRTALKITSLTSQLTSAQTALQNVKTAKTSYDNATNIREVAFKPLRPLATKIINALAATDALKQTIDDARTIVNKINGRRAIAIKTASPDPQEAAAPAVRISSASQQSYDKLVDHFGQLVALLAVEPKYLPNENELKVATLNTMLADLKTKNSGVINAITGISNARISRNKILYTEGSGLVDTAAGVKQYVKSLFNASSPQFKQVSKQHFKRATIL
jgi:hypothetical protein